MSLSATELNYLAVKKLDVWQNSHSSREIASFFYNVLMSVVL